MKQVRTFSLLRFVGLFLLAPFSLYAEISHYDLKGVDGLLSGPYSYLSPTHGFTLLGTKTLENLRFYGNYGPEIKSERTLKGKLIKRGYGCMEGDIGKLLRQNNDCPQDSMSELIQRLFPSQDGVNFVPNQIDSDITSHFDSETLGKIIGRLSLIKDKALTNSEEEKKLESELIQILIESSDPMKLLQKNLDEKRNLLIDCTNEDQKALITKNIGKLERALKEYSNSNNEVISDSDSHTSSALADKKKGTRKKKESAEFAFILIQAMKETFPGAKPGIYPPYLVEHVLLAYFFKRGQGRKDFISLVKGMHQLNPRILERSDILEPSSPLQQKFLILRYEKSDFDPESLGNATDQTVNDLLTHPEKMAFYATEDKFNKKTFPPLVSYGSANHSSLGDATYSDCGETSLRNFLNIAFFNSGSCRFDVGYLDKLSKNSTLSFPLSIHPNLKTYYHNHPDPALASSQIARDDWSETVASKHEGVEYLRPLGQFPQCEINAGIDNMMSVLGKLFFHGKNQNPLSKVIPRKERLDSLFKVLSREDFNLSWKLTRALASENEVPDTGVEIEISVNGEPSFIWQFHPEHFALQEIPRTGVDWKDSLGEKISTYLKHQGVLPSK